jgi:LysM repeat protein
MRVNLKPAAAIAAAAFLLLLVCNLTWPGHGLWLLVVGIVLALSAAYVGWRDHLLSSGPESSGSDSSPFSNVGAYGLTGNALLTSQQQNPGIPVSAVLAPISALAILLFVGGAIGSGESAVEETSTTLQQNVSVIDRSRDGEPVIPSVEPPVAGPVRQDQTTTTVSTGSTPQPQTQATGPEAATEAQQAKAPVKPIVVAAPSAASPADAQDEQAALVPESANTFEYTVEEGDTLYDIANRYNATVEAIMSLNRLDAYSFIHPGDVLLIPLDSVEPKTDES